MMHFPERNILISKISSDRNMQGDESDIRSETQVALTDDMTERVVCHPLKSSDTIVLRTRRRNYLIKVANFAKHSEKISVLMKRGNVPPMIDLSCYNIGAVRTLTDFVAGVDQRNLRLGDNILTDLLQLARIFRMHQFTSLIVEHVIEKVENGPPSNLLLALNLVSSDWSMFLHVNEASALVNSAVENIKEVATSTFFYILPAAVLVMLYSRCDVDVSSELELSQRLIRWLKKMVRTDGDAEMLFSCVRTPFLSPKDREIIRDKCIGLTKSMISVIENTLNSPRNHRCCVIREHIERRYPRCGIPDSNNYFRINAISVTTKAIADKAKKNGKDTLSSLKQHLETDLNTARGSDFLVSKENETAAQGTKSKVDEIREASPDLQMTN
uniref:BACK domain-containing protein n=1 Tax=Setaria digitata TaxID=48799 RepID=A0A915PRV0_9BILA